MSTPWTPQEDSRLLFYVGLESVPELSMRLGRSVRSVLVRYRRAHGGVVSRACTRAGGMSVTECARALGIHRQRVQSWIGRGWLKSRKRIVIERMVFTITDDDLEAFIRAKGGLLSGLRPTAEWFDIVEEAQRDLHARYVSRVELSALFCLSGHMFTPGLPLDRDGFPLPALFLQSGQRWYERAAVKAWLETAHPRYRTARALRAFGLEASDRKS